MNHTFVCMSPKCSKRLLAFVRSILPAGVAAYKVVSTLQGTERGKPIVRNVWIISRKKWKINNNGGQLSTVYCCYYIYHAKLKKNNSNKKDQITKQIKHDLKASRHALAPRHKRRPNWNLSLTTTATKTISGKSNVYISFRSPSLKFSH
jgi:hypothetical protein